MPFHKKIKSGFQAFQDERARKKGFSSASEMNINIAAARHRGMMEGKRIARNKLLKETRESAKSKFIPAVTSKKGGSTAEQKIQRGLGMARMFLGTDQPPPKRSKQRQSSDIGFGSNNFDNIFGTQSIRKPSRRRKAKPKKKRRKSRPRQTGGPFGDFGY